VQVRRTLHSYRTFATVLTVLAFLLLGSGAVQTTHLRAASANARAENACSHDHSCDEGPTHHDEGTCGTCVALALAGSAPQFVDAPILALGILTCVVVVDDDVVADPEPLRCVAARPPPPIA